MLGISPKEIMNQKNLNEHQVKNGINRGLKLLKDAHERLKKRADRQKPPSTSRAAA
jgi:hypothetical protein